LERQGRGIDLFKYSNRKSRLRTNFEEKWTLRKRTLSSNPSFKLVRGKPNEIVHLSAPNPQDEGLVWIFNDYQFPGPFTMKNSLKVVVSPSTVGIYICLKCNGGECVLIRIVEQIVERTFCTVEGGPRLPSGLLLMPDNLCSDSVADGKVPSLCRVCSLRSDTGNIFEYPVGNPIHVTEPRHTPRCLEVKVCKCAVGQFQFTWRHNSVEFPDSDLSRDIRVADDTVGMWICLAKFIDGDAMYCSSVFVVDMTPDPLVHPEEESTSPPSKVANIQLHEFQAVGGDIDCPQPNSRRVSPSGHYPSVQHNVPVSTAAAGGEFGFPQRIIRRVSPSDYPYNLTGMSQNCEVPVEEDSERSALSSHSKKLKDYLERFTADFLHIRMDFSFITGQDVAVRSILLKLMDRALADREFVEAFFCDLTTDDSKEPTSETRTCDVRVYSLIKALVDSKSPDYHRQVGSRLLRDLPLPPMFESWNPSTVCGSLYPEHCEVHLHACAYNADFLEWRHDGTPIYSIRTSPIHKSEIHCKVTVTETTCGTYCCVAYNNQNTLSSRTSPPTGAEPPSTVRPRQPEDVHSSSEAVIDVIGVRRTEMKMRSTSFT
jgi:hypothetical protein